MIRFAPVTRNTAATIAAIAIAALLSSCGPLVKIGDSGPRPNALLTLATGIDAGGEPGGEPGAAGQEPAPGRIDPATALQVDIPTLPGVLRTVRVPVRVGDSEVRYVVGAEWAEEPNRLFQRLVADRLVADGIAVLDLGATGEAAGQRLAGQLLEFGVDLRRGRLVRIRYDATLVGPAGAIRQQRFTAAEPVAAVNGEEVAAALNKAAAGLATAVSAWVRSANAGAAAPAATTPPTAPPIAPPATNPPAS